MSTTLDDVIETVLRAREDDPDALAAVAMSFGATMALGTLRIHALHGQVAELRAAMAGLDEMRDALRHERDAACAELKAALEDRAETRAEVWWLRESLSACSAERDRQHALVDAAREERDRAVQERDESQAAHEHTRAQWATACRERDEAGGALVTAGKIAAEAVREREAFGLRASAAERERDEARTERDALRARPTYEARTTMPTPEERAAHLRAGARWLRATPHHVSITHLHRTESVEHLDGATWLPLGADGLPCAWPVVAAEVSQ